MADTLQSQRNVFQDAICTLNQGLLYGAIYSTVRIHRSGNQEAEMRGALLFITLSDPPVNFFFPVSTTLDSATRGVLAPKGGRLPPDVAVMIH